MNQYLRTSMLVLPLLLSGCMTSGMDDLISFVESVKARPPGRLEPLPEIKQIETFIYIPGDRRNPFEEEEKASVEQEDQGPTSDNGIKPDFFRRKEELESFPLDSIRMVGTMDQGGVTWGLVMTGGIIYRVRVGNYMGDNHGQIMRILEGKIELTEIIPNGKGGYRERRASMALDSNE